MGTNVEYYKFKSTLFNKEQLFKELYFNIRLETINTDNGNRFVPKISYIWTFFEAKCNNKLFLSFFATCIEYANQTIINDCLKQELIDVELLKDVWYNAFISCVKDEGIKL